MKLHPYGLAFALALPTVLFCLIIGSDLARDVLSMLLVVIAAIYIGYGLADGSVRAIATEVAVGTVFLAFALLGLRESTTWLVVGYVLHGFWDYLHNPRHIPTRVPNWYPPFCAVYDWLIALLIVVWLK